MSDPLRPAKRIKYDLDSTFDVQVGSKTFTLHTNIFVERSGFFRAARKPEWTRKNPNKPVDMTDEDADVFNTYINCVYVGSKTLQHYSGSMNPCSESEDPTVDDNDDNISEGFDTLIRVYLLADKLQDLVTTNLVVDEIMKFNSTAECVPWLESVSFVYRNTPANSPLRMLMRDFWMYNAEESSVTMEKVKRFNSDFICDITLELFRVKQTRVGCEELWCKTTEAITEKDKCYYHQHDDKHPRCVPKPSPCPGKRRRARPT